MKISHSINISKLQSAWTKGILHGHIGHHVRQPAEPEQEVDLDNCYQIGVIHRTSELEVVFYTSVSTKRRVALLLMNLARLAKNSSRVMN